MLALMKIVSAQQIMPIWVNQIGGPNWDVVSDIASFSNGDIVISGCYYDSINVNQKVYYSNGSRDVFLAKYSDEGKLINFQSFGGNGFDYSGEIVFGTDDVFLTSVKFENEIIIDGISFKGLSEQNHLLSFFDSELKLQKAFQLSGSGKLGIEGFGLASDGDFCFGGWFTDTLSFNGQTLVADNEEDAFFAKVDKKGRLRFFNMFGGAGNDRITAVSVAKNGKITISGVTKTGKCMGQKFTPVSISHEDAHYLFVAEINNSGKIQHVEYPVSGYDITPVAIQLLNDKVWLATSSKYSIFQGRDTIFNNGNLDIQLISSVKKGKWNITSIDGTGKELPVGFEISGEQLILLGTFTDSLIVGKKIFISDSISTDIFFASFNEKGEAKGAMILKGPYGDFPCALTVDDGEVFMAGEFKDTLFTEAGVFASQGKEDIFIARMENCGAVWPLDVSFSRKKGVNDSWMLDAGDGFKYYNWQNGMSNSQIFEAHNNGIFELEVETVDGCIYRTTVEIGAEKSALLDVDDERFDGTGEFKLYPSITDNTVYWEPDKTWNEGPCTVRVFNALGQVVLSRHYNSLFKAKNQLMLNSLNEGSYTIKISGNNFQQTSKVILKK